MKRNGSRVKEEKKVRAMKTNDWRKRKRRPK
jgi:hypothetical protein